jgi:multidrug efflux pump subunit AcrA (membrane-fusion protein)
VTLITWALAGSLAFASIPDAGKKKPTVFVDTARATALFDVLTYPARVVSRVNAVVLSESEGVVQKIFAPLGTRVKNNEKLLILKNTDPVYRYAAVAAVAPVAGVVSAVDVTIGSRVARGQRLMQITDPSQIRISVEVAASDLEAIRTGLAGELTVPGNETRVNVQVVGVSPYVDPATGTATAELSLVGATPAKLPPGIVGKVTFKARGRQGIQIPEHAVSYQERNPYVRVVVGGKAKFVPVTLGPTRLGMVEILKGLENDMVVVVRASTFVAEGEEVQVETQKPAGQGE